MNETKTDLTCTICKKPIITPADSRGSGYALDRHNRHICYACCGRLDLRRLIRAKPGFRSCLYLTFDKAFLTEQRRIYGNQYRVRDEYYNYGNPVAHVSNWPGTVSFAVKRINVHFHNIAGRAYHFHFDIKEANNGKTRVHHFYGVQYGDNTQAAHIRKIKG